MGLGPSPEKLRKEVVVDDGSSESDSKGPKMHDNNDMKVLN